MAVAVTDGAVPVTMMERRLLHESRVVTSVNASERNGIRRDRRTKSECSESCCGQNRFHVFYLLERAASWCNLLPCFMASGASAAYCLQSHLVLVPCAESTVISLSRCNAERVLTLS